MKKIFLLIVVLILFYLSGCSIKPVSGTETGNPDISAVLSCALSTFDTIDRWNPSYYLPDGESLLNPQRISNVYHNYVAKKRNLFSENVPDTYIIHNVLIDNDKIILTDTIFIYDTVITKAEKEDTLTKNIDSTEILFVNKKFIYDTLLFRDTIVKKDTLIITKDTISNSIILTNNKGESLIRAGDGSSDTLNNLISYVIINDNRALLDTLDYKTEYTKGETVSTEVRSYSMDFANILKIQNNNLSITESYEDLDGDGRLFSASSNEIARTTYNLYHNNIEERTKELKLDFDAGSDNIFSTTENNRIINLLCKYTDKNYYEEVAYGILYSGYHNDTLFLNKKTESTNLKEELLYICIRGNDTLNHRENRLISCNIKKQNLSSESIKKYEAIISFDIPLSLGQQPSTAILNSTIDFGKGRFGIIEALIDYVNNSITGKYMENGKEYSLTYTREDNTLIIQE